MGLHAVKIQEINITNSSKKDILKEVEKYLDSTDKSISKPFTIVTPNPEQIVLATKDLHFAQLLNRADVSLPDGIGLRFARPMEISETIPGVEFMENLVAIAADRHVSIALIGGKSNVAIKTLECLRQKYPNLSGVAMDAPEFTFGPSGLAMNGSIAEYFKELVQEMKMKKIGMVFVALGAPKQEYFMERLTLSLRGTSQRVTRQSMQIASPSERTRNDKGLILMSVGGSFDEISGRISRAPRWVSRLGMKWLWRLILEPWRIKRQIALVRFVWMVFLEKLSSCRRI